MLISMKSDAHDDGWRTPEALWRKIEPLLPKPKSHPLGCHNPRVPDRTAMDAILLVLRTGCKWRALDGGKFCSRSAAHRRFQEWKKAGVFALLHRRRLLTVDELAGINWAKLIRKS